MKKLFIVSLFVLYTTSAFAFGFGGGGGGRNGIGISTGTDGTYGWYTSNNTTYSDCATSRYNVFWEGGSLKSCANNGTKYAITHTIASGTATLGTSAISSGACATVVSVAATGVLTTDVVHITPAVRISQVTGYGYATTGSLRIDAYPTAGYVNFEVCNNTAASITPGALDLNWTVPR